MQFSWVGRKDTVTVEAVRSGVFKANNKSTEWTVGVQVPVPSLCSHALGKLFTFSVPQRVSGNKCAPASEQCPAPTSVCVCVCVCVCVWIARSCPTLCSPMDCSLQALQSMEFSRQEPWSGLPFPSQARDLPHCRQILDCLSHQCVECQY